MPVANWKLLYATKDFSQATRKRCCRNLRKSMLQWYFSSLMKENRLVLFSRNALSQAARGAGFACKQKLPSAGGIRDASSHLVWDQGTGTTGERWFPDSWHYQQYSTLHHTRCLGSRCIWDTSIPTLMLSNKEWNVGCFWGMRTTLPKKH